MTNVFGANTLWLESLPGKNDYRPMEMKYGEFLQFNGNECKHHTVKNETDVCRVSFDFRVIPAQLCTKRGRMGEFPMEETIAGDEGGGYIAHPHPALGCPCRRARERCSNCDKVAYTS